MILHVSPGGDDQNPGTLVAPLRSLAKAVAASRYRTSDVAKAKIVLRAGRHAISSNLTLGPQDAGLSIVAYRGESPTISGGAPVTGWTLVSGSLWRAPWNGRAFRQMYVDGVRARRTRGGIGALGTATYTVPGYDVSGGTIHTWRNVGDVECIYPNQWTESRCRMQSATSTKVAMSPVCWRNGRHLCQIVPGEQPPGSGLVPWDGQPVPGSVGGTGRPVHLENAYELLGNPGEFYLDRTEGYVYYTPRAGEDMATATTLAAVVDGVLVTGSGIRFRGLTFSHFGSLWVEGPLGLVELQAGVRMAELSPPVDGFVPFAAQEAMPANVEVRGNDVRFERCDFKGLGDTGLAFTLGASNGGARGCRFSDVSGSGCRIENAARWKATDLCANVVIENCVATTVGVEHKGAIGFLALGGVNSGFRNCLGYGTPYSTLSLGLGWGNPASTPNTFAGLFAKKNHLFGAPTAMPDAGLIYTNGVNLGTIIEGNLLHDTINPGGPNPATAPLYLDYGNTATSVRRNAVYGVADGTFGKKAVYMGDGGELDVSYNWTDATDSVQRQGYNPSTVIKENVGASPTMQPPSIALGAGLETAYRDLVPAIAQAHAWRPDGTAPPAVGPGTPAGLRILQSGTNAVLTWGPPTVVGSGLKGYEVWLGGEVVGYTDQTKFVFDDLRPSLAHDFAVRAVDTSAALGMFVHSVLTTDASFTGRTSYPAYKS